VDVSQFPNNLAYALNIPLFAGQLLASVILMSFFLFPTMMLTHGKTRQEIPITFIGVGTLSVCIALGWTPYFVMLLIIMMVAFAYADKIRSLFSGK